MGDPMARNLLTAGFELTIYDTSAAAIEPLKALGAQVAKSPLEVANAAEVVLVSLPSAGEIRMLGNLAGFRENVGKIQNRAVFEIPEIFERILN